MEQGPKKKGGEVQGNVSVCGWMLGVVVNLPVVLSHADRAGQQHRWRDHD